MSYQATEAVLTYSQAEGAARLVLIVIAAHADERGGNSYPGVPLICAESRVSDRGVRYALRQLLASGELIVDQPSRGRVPAVYSINLPSLQPVQGSTLQMATPIPATSAGLDASTLQITASNPANNDTSSLQPVQGSDTQPCKWRHSTLQMATSNPANGSSAYKEEPVLNSQENHQGGTRARAREDAPQPAALVTVQETGPEAGLTNHAPNGSPRGLPGTHIPVNPAAEERLHEIREAVRAAFGWPVCPPGRNAQTLEEQALMLAAAQPEIAPADIPAYAQQRKRPIYHAGFAADLLSDRQTRGKANGKTAEELVIERWRREGRTA